MKFVNCLYSEMDNARVSEVFNKPKYKFIRILKEMSIECLVKSLGRFSISTTHYLRLFDRLQHEPNSFPVAGHTHTHLQCSHSHAYNVEFYMIHNVIFTYVTYTDTNVLR